MVTMMMEADGDKCPRYARSCGTYFYVDHFIESSQRPWEGDNIITSIFQMRKLRPKEVRSLAHSNTTSRWRGWDLNITCKALGGMVSSPFLIWRQPGW